MTTRNISMALACALAVTAHAQDCQPYWIPPTAIPYGTGFAFSFVAHSTLVPYDNGSGPKLYIGGTFMPSRSRTLPTPIATWDGRVFSFVDIGLPLPTYGSLVLSDEGNGPALYAMGLRLSAPFEWWARRLEGTTWVAPNPSFIRWDINSNGGHIATGPMLTVQEKGRAVAYGALANPHFGGTRAARWNGTQWEVLGDPAYRNPTAMVEYDDGTGSAIYAATRLNPTYAPGPPTWAWRVAKWDGAAWHPFAQLGMSSIRAICAYDNGERPYLYIGGDGGGSSGPIMRWDGQSWSGVGGGVTTSPGGGLQVTAMAVFDDGTGPALFVAGAFATAGGVPARNIAKWDGHHWHPLNRGIGGRVSDGAMAVYNDGRGSSLFMAGENVGVTGTYGGAVLQWVGCIGQCYADCDNDGAVTLADFACFQDLFHRNNPYADCNGDGVLGLADFGCFQTKFALGCP
jgi:hypothetical protein